MEAMKSKLALQELLLWTIACWDSWSHKKCMSLCMCVRPVCHHKLIIFLLSHRSVTCHHLYQPVCACVSGHSCASVTSCVQSLLSIHIRKTTSSGPLAARLGEFKVTWSHKSWRDGTRISSGWSWFSSPPGLDCRVVTENLRVLINLTSYEAFQFQSYSQKGAGLIMGAIKAF